MKFIVKELNIQKTSHLDIKKNESKSSLTSFFYINVGGSYILFNVDSKYV